jgi:hypothetical protein
MKGKKSDYYTTAESYTDIDGQYKQFTMVDHDIKPTICKSEKIDIKKLNEDIKSDAERDIAEILSLPAVSFLRSGNMFAEDYIERNEEKGIIWREKMVREALTINPDMRRLVLLFTWRATVREVNWFDPIRDDHDAIIRGDWKKLI